jgi:hypothetical protein
LLQVLAAAFATSVIVGLVRLTLLIASNPNGGWDRSRTLLQFGWRALALTALCYAIVGVQRRRQYGRVLGLAYIAFLFAATSYWQFVPVSSSLWQPSYSNPRAGEAGEILGALIILSLFAYWFRTFGFSAVSRKYFSQQSIATEERSEV